MLPYGMVEIIIATVITRDNCILWMILKIPVSHRYYLQEEIHHIHQWMQATCYFSLR